MCIFRIAASFDPNNESDNAMISVYPFGDEIYAFTETPFIHRINKLTLESERLDVSKYVTIINHTSHPHVMSDGKNIVINNICHLRDICP